MTTYQLELSELVDRMIDQGRTEEYLRELDRRERFADDGRRREDES